MGENKTICSVTSKYLALQWNKTGSSYDEAAGLSNTVFL
jgi:hypothetical protein